MPRRTLIGLALFALVALAFCLLASDWLTLASVKAHRDGLIALCQRNMALTMAGFFAVFALWGAVCLPGAALMPIVGGMLFGPWLGTLLSTAGATAGATVAFVLARHLLRDWARERFGRVLHLIDRGIERDGALYLFMLRLVIVAPFFAVNPAMALTPMRLSTFVLASLVGMLVNTFIWVNAGTMLATLESVDDVLSWRAALLLALAGVSPLALKWLFFRNK